MKKIALTITDIDYEKFRFEAIAEKKSVPDIIKERIFNKPFSQEVLNAYEKWMDGELNKIMGEMNAT